jgi:ABC-2 type transport system ATP-binding protein
MKVPFGTFLKGEIKMIKIENLNKEYVLGVKVVKDLNLHIKPGEIFGFLGPNGAGKTTTLKMITGVSSIDKGSIQINGIDITSNPLEAKKQFGFVPDNPDIFLRLKGIEYLRFMASVYGMDTEDANKKIEEYAKRFEIYDALNKQINDYSHGMRQKIVLIGALIHEPKVWILDEPMTGLDPHSSRLIKDMIREHTAKGNTVLFSTHVLEVAEKLCNKVAIIKNGKIIANGTMAEVKKDKSLESAFLESANA